MEKSRLLTLDLNFQDKSQSIAAYLIRHSTGAVLVETGPASTLPALGQALARHGLTFRDITHVLLTHIHLDHAGAAGWFSRQGAQVHVHPNGAPHLLNPEKLITSATRIYGDRMADLWGEFLPVLPDKLVTTTDSAEIVVGDLRFVALHTPGHAEHHVCYLLDDICFSGDVGGVRIPGYQYMRAPMVPPELHFGKWLDSLSRLQSLKLSAIAPTHYGIFDDPAWHLAYLKSILQSTEAWLEQVMPSDPTLEQLRTQYEAWMQRESDVQQLSPDVIQAYTLANPLGMGADGMLRYWKKFRLPAKI